MYNVPKLPELGDVCRSCIVFLCNCKPIYLVPNLAQFFETHKHIQCCLWCMLMQDKCVILHAIDVRGTIMGNSWAGRCLEPGDRCPTNGDDEDRCVWGVESCPSCDLEPSSTVQTCYKCNIPPTCEGQVIHLRLKH